MSDGRKAKEFHFDTLVQGLADKLIKPAVPTALDSLERSNRKLWLNGAWIYTKAPANFREAFESGIRLGVVVIEWFVDRVKLPHVINDALEFIAVRVISQIPDYYNRSENKGKLEAEKDFQPMTLEEAKEIGRELGTFLLQHLKSLIDQILSKIGLPSSSKLGAAARFMQSLMTAPKEQQMGFARFWRWLHRKGRTKAQIATDVTDLKRMVGYYDESQELSGFTTAPLARQKILFAIGRRMKEPEFWSSVCKAASKSWKVAEDMMREFNLAIDPVTGDYAAKLEAENITADRKANRLIKSDQAKHDQRQAARRFSLFRMSFPKPGVRGIGFIALLAMAIGFIVTTKVMGGRNEPPTVQITKPADLAVLPFNQAVVAVAKIRDTELVTKVEYQLDGGERVGHEFFAANRVTASINLGVLEPGPHRIGVYAADAHGRIAHSEATFVIGQPPALPSPAVTDTVPARTNFGAEPGRRDTL